MSATYLTLTDEVTDTKRHAVDIGSGLEGYLIMDREMCVFKYPFENREDDKHMRLAIERLCEKITQVLQEWAYEDAMEDEE